MNEYAMEAENVTVQYVKGKRVKALNEFSLKLHKEQLIGLIGANGSGKTTFFKVCSGAIAATLSVQVHMPLSTHMSLFL